MNCTFQDLVKKVNELYIENQELNHTISILEQKLRDRSVSLSLEDTIIGAGLLNEIERKNSQPISLADMLSGNFSGNEDGGLSDDRNNPDEFTDEIDWDDAFGRDDDGGR